MMSLYTSKMVVIIIVLRQKAVGKLTKGIKSKIRKKICTHHNKIIHTNRSHRLKARAHPPPKSSGVVTVVDLVAAVLGAAVEAALTMIRKSSLKNLRSK